MFFLKIYLKEKHIYEETNYTYINHDIDIIKLRK